VLRTLIAVAYVVVGVIVANAHHYLHVHDLKDLASLLLAVLLWPLILAGVNLHIGTLTNGKR
jgi:hypothetical protein